MKKVLSFSAMLMIGLLLSQLMPGLLTETCYEHTRHGIEILLGVCLAFIMINVGREFEVDKSNIKSYAKDYLVAMLAAAMPWLLIALYYIFVLMPSEWWSNAAVWKESLLLSRFAAPTSAGILFTMLAAIGLQKSWIYKKIQVLAIFDDLDTILLMIPLQIAMIGMQWQMGVILVVVVLLLWIGWKKMSSYSLNCGWKSLLGYSALVYGATYIIYILTDHFFGEEGSVHIEVLLPAFVLGMVIKHGYKSSKADDRASSFISLLFMLLVGMSMPLIHLEETPAQTNSIIASLPMLSWGSIALHVVIISLLSNVGKLTPMLFYRERSLKERLALSVGMFTRGEVGAGVIFIALGYHIGGPILLISVLTLVFNLILTGGFVLIVKRLALSCER
ncbi:MAG: sodium:proton antiporter [Bacteroidaceae bacterium]|nr:sodium:proton antiporter [Bacteroidaceae bacterium]